MTTSLARILSILFLAGGLSLTATPAVSASAGSEFGHHVQSCAQVMGFDGAHNPGMHTGFAGWHPTHAC
ncbi:hypothetical protein [Nocardioides ganghwensis]|jgi:hypothetical protein|uniref:Uncharacterized protein n=1 Tax=Nocardioides ganghwensis TaxID=252230 RepID=A0A4Q2S8I0_9ACTN|nr:hypothetical protein [Nocardioides ganghwensis]MBD3947727.1 hypothetical protein [Nocardioides ganghwensis]RYB98298.1 hypothetical protein EUA07_18300 [Nocardioides ganghwensis]